MFFLITAVFNVVACSVTHHDNPELHHYFDKRTGANITSLARPLVFYREKPWLASNVRDYVYLGPIEVSRTGRNNYLLWLGIWSTIDQFGQPSQSVRDTFRTIFIVADGEPMELGINAWSGKDLGMSHAIYSTPVESAADAFYAVTKDQIRKLAQAETILIYPNADTPRGSEYAPWQEYDQSMTGFETYLSGE